MNENNAKCPHCGAELYVGLKKGTALCLTCKKQFDAEKAVKLYESIHKKAEKQEKKVATAGDYLEVDRILDRVEYYLARKQFDKAEEELNSALELTNTDYRVYFGFVRAETKNLTDYRNQSHKEYLNKAIACADADGKATITRLYKNFYHLSACTDEEIEQYKTEENQAIRNKAEKKLKTIIPAYMKMNSGIKIYPLVFSAFYLFGAAAFALALALKIELLYPVAFIFLVAGFAFTRSYIEKKRSFAEFNAVLDLYDESDKFGLSTDGYRELLDMFKEAYDVFAQNNNYTAQERFLVKICNYLSDSCAVAKKYVETHNTLAKFIRPEEEETSDEE